MQGGITCPYCMVLMGQRCPKQRHNAVAHDLVHRALVVMHRCHQALQDWVEEPTGLLRVTVSQQLHGPLQVSKQHGDLLALAFQDTTGR